MTASREQAELVMRALDGALREEENAVNDSLNRLGELAGWNGMFGACCAFAEAILRVTDAPRQDGVPFGLVAVHARTGQHVSIDRTGMEPDLVAAMRIVAAVGSKDFDAALAVFDTELAMSTERAHNTVAATLALAVEAIREHPKFGEVYGGQP